MRSFKIEKNIPVPDQTRRASGSKYPFQDMKIGDSFFMPLSDEGRVRAAIIYQHKTRPPRRYTTRRVQNGLRIWRVK